MICQVCNQQKATVHLTEITKNKKHEIHICPGCAKKKGYGKGDFVTHNFLGSLLGVHSPGKPGAKGTGVQCPDCGITYAEFRSSGRLGCPTDYRIFAKALLPFIERLHGSLHHSGKVPQGMATLGRKGESLIKLIRLRRDLNEAIENEQYEKAAEIRDRIRKLETASGGALPPAGGGEGTPGDGEEGPDVG